MARPLRIEFEGAWYHVMSRGNERCRIVKDDTDRARRLDWLRRTVETYRWHLHAFLVTNNHIFVIFGSDPKQIYGASGQSRGIERSQ